MDSNRRNAVFIGLLFMVAAGTAIISLTLYQPVLTESGYIFKDAARETLVIWGAICELVLVLSVIGITMLMYPVLNKENESIAIGYVCFRILEASIIMAGTISQLSTVTLNYEFVKATDPNTIFYLTIGKLFVTVHHWTFLLGSNLAFGFSTLIMSYFLYTSKLVPRTISILGLIGSPLIFTWALMVMLGGFLQISVWSAIIAVPVFAHEMTLAVWLIVKGFKSSDIEFSVVLNKN